MNSKRKSVFRDICRRQINSNFVNFAESTKDDEGLLQRLGLLQSLPIHQGCVNTICWNENGQYILSGSDDQHLVVTNGHNYKVEANYCTNHHANIFSAKFLPRTNDYEVISCSGDGIILHTDFNRPQETYDNQFNCHGGTTTYEVVTIPNDSSTFLSCGEDGTVRSFDLREKSSCTKPRCKDDILIYCHRAVTALAISPICFNQIAAGCADSTVRIYDRRMLSNHHEDNSIARPFSTFVAPHFGNERHNRITSLSYSSDGRDMLVSYSSDYLYLFGVQDYTSSQLMKPFKKMSSENGRTIASKRQRNSPPPVRRLRLRGDWSDTGPNARPESEGSTNALGQARPQLQATLMQRMTDVLSRMLNDPMTRAALSGGGEDSVDPEEGTSDQREGEAEASSANETQSDGTATTSHLQGHLTALRNLREGFIEQHGAEPSVSFRYSQQSTSNSTISLRVGREVNSNGGGARETAEEAVEETVETMESVESMETGETSQQEDGTQGDSGEGSSDYIESRNDEDVQLDYPEYESGTDEREDEEEPYIYEADMKMKYMGHRNSRTMIKEATFWGNDYVMSGSDCGHVFIWERSTGALKMLLQADQHVVNCLQPHPTMPLLATSGIDHDVKLWAPVLPETSFDSEMAADLINRNAIMLEETRDTITVPAAFMIRMLACLNQIRRSGRGGRATRRREDEEGEAEAQ